MQAQLAQLLAYHLLVGEQQLLDVLVNVQRQFAFLTFSEEQFGLCQCLLCSHALNPVVLVQDCDTHGDGNLVAGLHTGDDGTCHVGELQFHQRASEYGVVGYLEQAGLHLGELASALCVQFLSLLFQIDAHDLGQKFHEEDYTDYTEGIGYTIGYGSQVAGCQVFCAVNSNRQAGGGGQRSGHQAHQAGSVYAVEVFQSNTGQGCRCNEQGSDDDECLALALERVEETGTGLYADGEDEEHQSEIAQVLGNEYAEVSEEQCDEDNGRDVQ